MWAGGKRKLLIQERQVPLCPMTKAPKLLLTCSTASSTGNNRWFTISFTPLSWFKSSSSMSRPAMGMSPTGGWKLLVSWCHLSAITHTNPWEMLSYLVRWRGLRPDLSTGSQNQGLSCTGNGRDKAVNFSFHPWETPVILQSAFNWNTKKKLNK